MLTPEQIANLSPGGKARLAEIREQQLARAFDTWMGEVMADRLTPQITVKTTSDEPTPTPASTQTEPTEPEPQWAANLARGLRPTFGPHGRIIWRDSHR